MFASIVTINGQTRVLINPVTKTPVIGLTKEATLAESKTVLSNGHLQLADGKARLAKAEVNEAGQMLESCKVVAIETINFKGDAAPFFDRQETVKTSYEAPKPTLRLV